MILIDGRYLQLPDTISKQEKSDMRTSLPKKIYLVRSILVLMSLSLIHNVSAQDAAGRIVFAQGGATATNTAGVQRNLARGNEIFSGDRLITDNGRLQLSMVDGAFISVQPNSEYQIETYNYSGSPDGTEQASYRLVKGGVRAVTGLIGRQNPEAYKVNTAVATIGIRGTGHNTRICAGDCDSRPDGLYHHTWEGITFVVNDVDVEDVPSGTGVYVQDIDTEIEVLDQPPALLAVDTSREEVEEEEQENREAEEQTRIVAVAEQRDETGDQDIISSSRVNSAVLTNFGVLGVFPDDEAIDGLDIFEFNFGTSIFRRSSDSAGIGILGIEEGDEVVSLATIDIDAIRGGDNAAEVAVAERLLSAASPALIAQFEENPATSAEFFFNEEIGFGRWTDGNVLTLGEGDGDNDVGVLINHQSAHYIFGTQSPALPTLAGKATYNFLDGTQSTTVSGDTIGQGVTSGVIGVDFEISSAFLDMNVSHNSINYAIDGTLIVEPNDALLSDLEVLASGGDCLPCDTFIDASFAGPASGNFPKYIGLEYDILVTDPIMGVAAFSFSNFDAPATSTVLSGFGLIGVLPDASEPDSVDVPSVEFGASLFQRDSDSKVVGILGLAEDDIGPSTQVLATIDLEAVLGANNAAAAGSAQSLEALADSALIASFEANPASPVEFFSNGEIGYARWAEGNILVLNESSVVADNEIIELTGTQSFHYLFGMEPPAIPVNDESASYSFLDGTQSTSFSGSTIGNGITSGTIDVNFALYSADLDMNVSHNSIDYNVQGPLLIDPFDGAFFDFQVSGVSQVTATGGECTVSCETFIEGGFTGPVSDVFPKYAGFEYDIQTTDLIMGVGVFQFGSFTATPTSTVQTNSVYVGINPEESTTGWDASIFLDENDNVVGALGTEDLDSPVGTFRVVNTVDLDLMLVGDDSTSVTEVNSLITAQSTGDQSIISAYTSGAASIQDSFYDATDGIGWGRWTNGSVLSFDATSGTDENPLTGNQSAHFVFGKDPGVINTSGLATYNWSGGTSSTSASGSTIGDGATSGTIGIDFAGTGTINMNVGHNGAAYNVNGSLIVDPANGAVFDVTSGVTASTVAAGSACNPNCGAFIDGGFAGPNSGGVPKHIGIVYEILETDVIMGAAGFSIP